jgi:hypothetical protein
MKLGFGLQYVHHCGTLLVMFAQYRRRSEKDKCLVETKLAEALRAY